MFGMWKNCFPPWFKSVIFDKKKPPVANLAVRRRLQPAGGVELNYGCCVTSEHSKNMKTEARVTKANGETGFAMFDSVVIGDQIWLVLDKGQAPGIQPELLHPLQQHLIDESKSGVLLHYVGDPIDIREHLTLPDQRRGFVLTD